MSFQRPTLAELANRIEHDLASRLGLSGPALRRSTVVVLAAVEAGATHLLHGHIEFLSQQIFPDQSETSWLERHAALYGITRTAATVATGTVTLTGVNGVVVPAGTELQRADGAIYETTSGGTIASGTATIAVAALIAGADGNAVAATVLTLVSPISGVAATATVAGSGLVSGADAESDAALRLRVLERLQAPPQGGSSADYVRWAKEVSGVTRAWVYPGELGAGTVVVRFVRDGDGAGSAIMPSAGEVTDVADYLAPRRPVTAAVTVLAPVADALAMTIAITPDTADTRAAVTAQLTDLLARLAEPAGTIPLSQLLVAIGVAEGVTDFTLTTPSADVTHASGHMAVLGTITWV